MKKERMKKFVSNIIIIVIIIIVWQLVENVVNVNRKQLGLTSLEFFIPSPKNIATQFLNNFNIIQEHLIYSLFRAGLGVVLGTVFAILTITLINVFPVLKKIVLSGIAVINAFPVIGYAPAIVLMFGQGSTVAIVVIATLMSYIPILVTLESKITELNKKYLEIFKIYNANMYNKIKFMYLPLSIPSFFVAARLAIPAAIIGTIMGEWLGVRTGIGQLMTVCIYQLKSGMLYACLLETSFAGLIIITILGKIKNKIILWD